MSKLWNMYLFSRLPEKRMDEICRGVETNIDMKYRDAMATDFSRKNPGYSTMNRGDLRMLERIRQHRISTKNIIDTQGVDGLRFPNVMFIMACTLGMFDVGLINEQYWHLQYLMVIPVFTNHWETRWYYFWILRMITFAIFFILQSAFGSLI